MSYRQNVTPNINTTGRVGYCLSFVETAFNTPHLYPYAFTAWQATAHKHTDTNFPEGCFVPIWFSYTIDGINEGHVAIMQPSGHILSSPWNTTTSQAVLPTIADLERIYSGSGAHPLTYLGWSEDIAGVRVVEPVNEQPPLQPGQRIVGPTGSNYRSDPNTGATIIQSFAPGAVANFDGWIHGENHSGNDVWFHGHLTGHWAWSGSYTDPSTHDLADLNPPPPPVPKPYVPPAAPHPVKIAEQYEVLTTLPTYPSADEVSKAKNPTDIIQPGKYYVWAKEGASNNYWNLSDSNMQNQNRWINTIDNKKPLNVPTPPAPKPAATITLTAAEKPAPPAEPVETSADIQASWKWFYQTHEPVEYLIAKDYTVYDQVHGGKPIRITKDKTVEIYGTFVKSGITYLRPLTALNEKGLYNFYGIPTTDIYSGAPYLDNLYSVKDRVYYGVDLFLDKSIKTLEGIYRWIKKK